MNAVMAKNARLQTYVSQLQCFVFSPIFFYSVLLPHDLELKWIILRFASLHLQNLPTTLVISFYCEAIAQTLIGKLGVRGLARDISTMWQQEAATESTTFRLQENYTSL